MLDKRTGRFLLTLAKICSDGSYKIIDKSDLGKDLTAIEQMIRYLQDNEMIDVKYSDETVYCLSVLPKGRVLFETSRKKGRGKSTLSNKLIIALIAGCFVASILGAMLGALIARAF